MAHTPGTAQLRLPTQLMAALQGSDWRHRAYMFEWAIENLDPAQLALYYRYARRFRGNYHIKVQRLVDRMAFALNEYRAGRKRWRPFVASQTHKRVGNWARPSELSGSAEGCGCGCRGAGGCSGMGNANMFDAQFNALAAQMNQPNPATQQTQSKQGTAFDYTNPMHWMQVINGGVGVAGKVACMIDPNLAYCKGQAATPPNFDTLCAQPSAASTPACQQYLAMKAQGKLAAAQQQYNQQQTQKKDNTPLYLAAAVGLGVLFLGSSQPSRRR